MSPVTVEMPEGPVSFRRLVLDFTGTLSKDGELLPGVSERLTALAESLRVTVLTADTFGTAGQALAGLPLEVEYRPPRQGEVRFSYASTQKAREKLGYAPRVSLADGLRLTYDWSAANWSDQPLIMSSSD